MLVEVNSTEQGVQNKGAGIHRDGAAHLGFDSVRTQQDLDVLECGAGQVLVHHWLVHLLHKLQVQHMEVWLLHSITIPMIATLSGS